MIINWSNVLLVLHLYSFRSKHCIPSVKTHLWLRFLRDNSSILSVRSVFVNWLCHFFILYYRGNYIYVTVIHIIIGTHRFCCCFFNGISIRRIRFRILVWTGTCRDTWSQFIECALEVGVLRPLDDILLIHDCTSREPRTA